MSKLKEEDYTHRGFLKPIEIQLKTYKTESDKVDSKLKATSLPAGLKIVHKESILNNKYELFDVVEVIRNSSFEEMKKNSQDNILTLMK